MKNILYIIFSLLILSNISFAQTMEFRCDMSVEITDGNFDAATDSLKVNGDFNGWGSGTQYFLSDDDTDQIYSVVLDNVAADSTFTFKFVIRSGGTDSWESVANRTYTTTGTDDVFETVYNTVPTLGEITVMYECNMEYERVSGRFNPATDTLELRGVDHGWGPGLMMEPSTLNPDIYTYETTQGILEDTTLAGYKFWFNHEGSGVWEGGSDRIYRITADDLANGFATVSRTFNDATLETITNFPLTVLFTVNMTNATHNGITGNPFGTISTVHVAGAVPPLAWPDGGWPDTDIDLLIELVDDGTNGDVTAGDMIFSREVLFPQYSPLTIQYKFGANWGDTNNNGGGNDNESGVAADHFLHVLPSDTYVTVVNTFSVMGDCWSTGLEESSDSDLPESYTLQQNYPNPFNPSTTIKFSLPEEGMVSLTVYNTLGQEVAKLVNKQLSVGSYEYSFDASNLSSGVYIYSIRANNFVQTRKMLLLK